MDAIKEDFDKLCELLGDNEIKYRNERFNKEDGLMESSRTPGKYDKNIKNLIIEIDENPDLYYEVEESRRQNIKKSYKKLLWETCRAHNYFDEDIIRRDILGNVVIKNIKLNNNKSANRIFAFEYEHIVSFSMNGSNKIENYCILNACINRVKGDKPLYRFSYLEAREICMFNAIKFSELLEELQKDLHKTCKEYNLIFYVSDDNKYTLLLDKYGEYMEYDNRYK